MKEMQGDEKRYLRVFRQIRSYIIDKNLEPGDQLPTEAELCEMLKVSRNVVREAIKSMELMGMVEARPGRGTVVRPFSVDYIAQNVLFFSMSGQEKHIREMFDIRRNLEMAYLREAFHALRREDIAHISECARKIRDAYEKNGMFNEEDREFHMSIFRPMGNEVLLSMMDAIWAVDVGFELEKKHPHLSESVEKHEAIAWALENLDYRAFARAMERHFSSGKYLPGDSYEEF